MSKTIVKKFGGTSVGSTDKLKHVANLAVESKSKFENVVIVVSAMGNTTNQLVTLAKEISLSPEPREYDALISTGENISASLLAMCLIEMGHKAISLTGQQAGITTEKLHSKAKILDINTKRIQSHFQKGYIVIITGFQGINENEDITTIGRGGSDTSAVALAAALNCEVCEIYTDVDGVYTTDPRVIKDAKKINEISYDEMLELASLGAKVLHPRAVECAKENGIMLHVRSTFSKNEGTRVKEVKNLEINVPVTGIAFNDKETIISILDVPDNPGLAGQLFSKLADEAINVDMIIQNVENQQRNNISFSVMEDDFDKALAVTQKVQKEIGASNVISNTNIAKLSIVGVGMISRPGIAAKMFNALGLAKINILRITTSEIKISCAIARENLQEAISVLHTEFNLAK